MEIFVFLLKVISKLNAINFHVHSNLQSKSNIYKLYINIHLVIWGKTALAHKIFISSLSRLLCNQTTFRIKQIFFAHVNTGAKLFKFVTLLGCCLSWQKSISKLVVELS